VSTLSWATVFKRIRPTRASRRSNKRRSSPEITVATHNIMDGLKLAAILRNYSETLPPALSLLCVQELTDSTTQPLLSHFGRKYGIALTADAPRMGTVYRADLLRLRAQHSIPLPVLPSLSRIERTYISGGKPELKHAHISIFRARKRVQRDLTNVVVANVHLDAAGGNTHRANQMACVAQALRKYARAADVVIVAGDTNCFELNREKQAEMLQGIMTPLVDNGLCDVFDSSGCTPTDTHYFARADEPKLGHQLMVALGSMGVDAPRRYDIIASSTPAHEAVTVHTPDSDHDLVWARVAV